MPENKEKIFADGIYFEKREGAPSFVIGSLSMKVAEVVPFLQMHEKKSGYVNVDIKQSQGGKYYCELNVWQPKPVNEVEENQAKLNNMDTVEYPTEDINPDEIHF